MAELVSRLNSYTFETLLILSPMLPLFYVDHKNKMVFQIQTILHLFTFGTEDADIENYLTRQPIIVRIEG